MNFGQIVEELKQGKAVRRAGWNGKGIFVYYVPASNRPVHSTIEKMYFGHIATVSLNAHFAIKNVDNNISTWVPSINDCLADDWEVVKDLAVL